MRKVQRTKRAATVTPDQLQAILQPITGSTFATITYVSDVDGSRQKGGKKLLQKRTQARIALNHNYGQKVRRLTGDASFVAQKMKGTRRISGTLLASEKTGEIRLDAKVLKTRHLKRLGLFHNGQPITWTDAVAANMFMPSYFESPRKTAGRGTVAAKDNFLVISPRLSIIEKIVLRGVTYTVKPAEQ